MILDIVLVINLKTSIMKKDKKISLQKRVISNLQTSKIKGGTIQTTLASKKCNNIPTGACSG